MRPPVLPVEDIAALLHMSLDQCRHLLAAYDSLVSTNALWLFEPQGGEEDDEGEDEQETDDDEDIPF